ncbi:ectopic P granules protein 5 homolog [Oppia nitens]|uniref:ectopic P granules protein 5 homolog n=1 Tax=Oppia nitens TaxID=1686743 RepID=UPI0023DC65B2|nr:ectopic P granules protein 5 homolog [Oppia nitens]
MTDFGQSKLTDKCVDSLEILLTNHHYLPFIHLLYTLIPYHLKQYEILLSNSKLLNLLSQLFANYSKETISLIYHQISRFSNQENKLKLIICWTELLFKVIITIAKANSNSWFNSCAKKFQQFGYIFEKIAIILYMDNELLGLYLKYLSEYQFDNQFLKIQNSGWMSSMFNLNSSSNKKYEFVTPLHVIYKQNATNVWLGWLIIQSDIIRFDKYWDQIVNDISDNPVITPEIAIKSISKKNSEQNISTDLLPINSLSILTMNSPSNPPNELEPYIWFKFFQFYFTNTQSNRSVGELFISEDKVKKLVNKLNSLVDYHLKQWLKCDANGSAVNDIDDNLTKLYRAYISWLEDSQLHEVFVNINELPPQYLKDILKCAISNTEFISFRHKYFSIKVIETSISEISNLWTQIHSTFNKFDVFVEDYYKSYAIENEEPLSAPEVKKSNLDSFNIDIETINNSSALLLLIQHNVRVILEEAKFFESLLNKFVDLNKKLVQLLPDLYPKIKKDIKLTATCDKDNYDAYGCAGPAVFNIEITEAIINQHSEKSIERNRIDFENIIIQLIETPSNKVVLASLFIEKSIPLLLDCYDFHDKDSQIERSLLGSLLSWINDTNYMYAPSKRMFTNLLESLETISEQRCDETNQFILETAINHPKMNEYMTPYLTPSKTSTKCFLDMYKMIDQKLLTTPPQVSFVLLSKFDVSLWFRNASPEQRLSLIQVVGNAINKFGHNPKDEYLMILELYRKHWKWMCEWSPLF